MADLMRSAYIAIVGRPNVGKSTLLNRLLGEKISITSRKPQTTRHRILGIKTINEKQMIFVDTPGLHLNPKHALNRMMIKTALDSLHDVDMIMFVVDARRWTEEDQYVLEQIKPNRKPVFLVINKIDRLESPDEVLPLLINLQKRMANAGYEDMPLIPISAKNGKNVKTLEDAIIEQLPEGMHYFPEDQITDRSERFLAAELVREKLMRFMGEEVPHAVTVSIDEFKQKGAVLHIHATIWVERDGQKIIIIGENGQGLKNVGRLARLDMERIFEQKVFLQLWVKVKRGWSDDERALASLGYGDDL